VLLAGSCRVCTAPRPAALQRPPAWPQLQVNHCTLCVGSDTSHTTCIAQASPVHLRAHGSNLAASSQIDWTAHDTDSAPAKSRPLQALLHSLKFNCDRIARPQCGHRLLLEDLIDDSARVRCAEEKNILSALLSWLPPSRVRERKRLFDKESKIIQAHHPRKTGKQWFNMRAPALWITTAGIYLVLLLGGCISMRDSGCQRHLSCWQCRGIEAGQRHQQPGNKHAGRLAAHTSSPPSYLRAHHHPKQDWHQHTRL